MVLHDKDNDNVSDDRPERMQVLLVEDEVALAEAIREGPRAVSPATGSFPTRRRTPSW